MWTRGVDDFPDRLAHLRALQTRASAQLGSAKTFLVGVVTIMNFVVVATGFTATLPDVGGQSWLVLPMIAIVACALVADVAIVVGFIKSGAARMPGHDDADVVAEGAETREEILASESALLTIDRKLADHLHQAAFAALCVALLSFAFLAAAVAYAVYNPAS
jgi:hypothetical protein